MEKRLTEKEIDAMVEAMADAEFGDGTFADWYNQKSD